MPDRKRILLSPPEVGPLEREALLRAFDSNWISTVGPDVDAFELEMEQRLQRPCVALSSGTAGIHLALRLAGVQAGDTVLCQSFTFVATANPILYEHAIPYFLDSEETTWNLDPALLEEAIIRLRREGVRPKALVVVHLYGTPARMDRIRKVCQEHEVAVIEDAAESLGAAIGGQPVGTLGMAGVFSFNGNKIITTAGGGMLALSSDADKARVRKWSTQSREACLHYEHTEIGFNYRMSNLLAAVGRAQLAQLDDKVMHRRGIAERYRQELSGVGGLRFPAEPSGVHSTFWLSCMVLQCVERSQASEAQESERDRLIAFLDQAGIETRPLWKPMHLQPLFQGSPVLENGVSERLFRSGICLPSSSSLSEDEQQHVIDSVKRFFGLSARRVKQCTPVSLDAA